MSEKIKAFHTYLFTYLCTFQLLPDQSKSNGCWVNLKLGKVGKEEGIEAFGDGDKRWSCGRISSQSIEC